MNAGTDRARRANLLSTPLLHRFLIAASLALLAAPGFAAAPNDDLCKGHWVRRLGTPHAVSKTPLKNLADLQARLPQLEAGMRDMIARDGSLGVGVADALFAAIRNGSTVVERKLGREESFQWMVYQPKKGQLALISPPCVQLKQDYDAFEVTVTVADAEATATAEAKCSIVATRNCEPTNPTITVDLTGSSSGAKVTRSGQAITGQSGMRWTVADATPCSADETFTVTAQSGGTAGRKARVYKFIIPKICSNLSYIGEGPSQTITETAAPKSCDKSVTVAQCKPTAELSVDPMEVEVHNPTTIRTGGGWSDCTSALTAECDAQPEPITLDATGATAFTPGYVCCGDGFDLKYATRNASGQGSEATAKLNVRQHDWVFRPALAFYMPSDGDISRDINLPFGATGSEKFEVDDGIGISGSLEKRFNARWGLEFGSLFGKTETTYELSTAGVSGEDDHDANFYAFTVGPNLHFRECLPDFYVGLFLGYGGLADPNYWVFDHHFHAEFDGQFVYGAQIGLDVPFKRTSDWGFHAGLKYFILDQETDAGTIDIDPLIGEIGLSYRF